MTANEFVIWLEGYIAAKVPACWAHDKDGNDIDNSYFYGDIKDKIEEVKKNKRTEAEIEFLTKMPFASLNKDDVDEFVKRNFGDNKNAT